jgi:hypothetical protein
MKVIELFKKLLERLNISQNLRFHRIIVERVSKLIAGVPVLSIIFMKYAATVNAADDRFMLPKAAPQSPEMDELETKRDGLFKLIVHTVSDKLKYSIDENVKAAAKIIMPILDTFAKIDKHEREDETQDIIKLIERLLAHTAELTTLAILDEVNSLRVVNEEFQALYEERIDYDYSGTEGGTSTQHRVVMNKAFTAFMAAVYGQQLVVEDEDLLEKLDEMVTSVNAVIKQFKIILNRHLAKTGGKDDGAEEIETEEDEDDYLPEEEEDGEI